MSNAYPQSPRNRVERARQRADYERDAVWAIIDEAKLCHVGFNQGEQPFVIPMVHARDGDRVYLHGSVASRLMGALAEGIPLCLSVTLLDGLVLARSAFHHSMNYRSVVAFGVGRLVEEEEEKRRALDLIVDHMQAGRSREARAANRKELNATHVIAVDIEEASAKARRGGVNDDEKDLNWPCWAGVIPVSTSYGTPEPADDLKYPSARI